MGIEIKLYPVIEILSKILKGISSLDHLSLLANKDIKSCNTQEKTEQTLTINNLSLILVICQRTYSANCILSFYRVHLSFWFLQLRNAKEWKVLAVMFSIYTKSRAPENQYNNYQKTKNNLMIILIIRRKQKKLIVWFTSWYSVFLEFTDFIFLPARCSRVLRLVTRHCPQTPSSLFSIATQYQLILRKRSWSTLLIGRTGS